MNWCHPVTALPLELHWNTVHAFNNASDLQLCKSDSNLNLALNLQVIFRSVNMRLKCKVVVDITYIHAQTQSC